MALVALPVYFLLRVALNLAKEGDVVRSQSSGIPGGGGEEASSPIAQRKSKASAALAGSMLPIEDPKLAKWLASLVEVENFPEWLAKGSNEVWGPVADALQEQVQTEMLGQVSENAKMLRARLRGMGGDVAEKVIEKRQTEDSSKKKGPTEEQRRGQVFGTSLVTSRQLAKIKPTCEKLLVFSDSARQGVGKLRGLIEYFAQVSSALNRAAEVFSFRQWGGGREN